MNHVGNLANLVDIQVFQVSVNGKPRRYASLFPDREQHLGNLARKPLVISLKAYQDKYMVKNLEPMAKWKQMLYANWSNLTARIEVDTHQARAVILGVILVLLQVERMRVHRLRMPAGVLVQEVLILMLTLTPHRWGTDHAIGRSGLLQVQAKESHEIGLASIYAG